jgi:hypothetical protein
MINPVLSLHRVGNPVPLLGRELEADPSLEPLG